MESFPRRAQRFLESDEGARHDDGAPDENEKAHVIFRRCGLKRRSDPDPEERDGRPRKDEERSRECDPSPVRRPRKDHPRAEKPRRDENQSEERDSHALVDARRSERARPRDDEHEKRERAKEEVAQASG